jgi:integrase
MPIKPKPLTDSKISRSFYKIGGKNRFPDENGVALVLLSDGRRRWTWRGVIPGRDDRTMRHLGYWPAMDREAAQRAAADLAGGKQSDTVEDYFRRLMASIGTTTAGAKNIESRLRVHVIPKIGKTPVKDITHKALLESLMSIESRVNRYGARSALGQLFDIAVLDGVLAANPARSIPTRLLGEKPKVTHYPAILDRERLGAFLRAIDTHAGLPQMTAYLKLLLLTAARPSEVREMKWSDVSLEEALWRRHVSKVDLPHVCPLARQAVEIIEELKPLTGHTPGPFYNGKKPITPCAGLKAIHSLGFGRQEMTQHGCRAIFRSLGDEIGIDPVLMEMQLSHRMPGPLGRAYSRFEKIEERRQDMQRWADFLDELRGSAA